MKERIVGHDRANEKLQSALGRNIYGEANFRMVRSDGRKEYYGKKEGWAPKYPQYHCWILEKWCPPEMFGSKHDWTMADLGPFPSHGEYEVMWAFEEVDDFSDHQIDFVIWAIEQNRNMTRTTRWARIKEREEKAKQADKDRIRAIVNDASQHEIMTTVPNNYAVAKIDIPKGSSKLKGTPNV